MNEPIYQQLEAITERIIDADGKCIIIAHDGESEGILLAPILQSVNDATSLFKNFFQKFPEFIPKAMYAASLAMECDGDCENCQLCDYDDGEEEDDDEDEEFSMNLN